MQSIDEFTILKAAGAGVALARLNPKNVALTVAAATEIAAFGLPAEQQVAVLVVFVSLTSIGILTPLVLSIALGARSHGLVDGLRRWMARNAAAVMAVLFVFIGVKLIGDAVSGFV
jgi:threonine/homoserine/homoserine lactone efflux protein